MVLENELEKLGGKVPEGDQLVHMANQEKQRLVELED